MTQQKKTFPGIVRSVKEYPEAPKVPKRRTIEEKRQTVIRGIEQHLKGEKGAPCLERLDPQQNAPVIRVLYASRALPVFNGERFAAIDPQCDRTELWRAITAEIRAGTYDAAIEEVSQNVYQALGKKQREAAAA